MDIAQVMLLVLLIAAVVVCGVAVWALREVALAAKSIQRLSDDSRERLNPLLDKADVTVDAINVEILRVDALIARFEDASERVTSASGTISGIVNAPAEIVNDVAGRVRRAWKDRSRSHADAKSEVRTSTAGRDGS